MKITFKRIIKALTPYGILYLWRKLKNFKTAPQPVATVNLEQPELRKIPEPIWQPPSSVPPPPNIPPKELFGRYAEEGKIDIFYKYSDDRTFDYKHHNSPETYENVFQQLDQGSFQYYATQYGNKAEALLAALDKYDVKGKDVVIWGLAGCNCEAMAMERRKECIRRRLQ
jgi:hypothetical protein